jgi:hypothetical protein
MWEDIPRPATRHNWDLKPDVMLRCVRCSTEKFLWLNAEGQIVGTPQYDYAEGYNLKGLYQGDKLTVAELRAEIVSRHRKGRKLKSVK